MQPWYDLRTTGARCWWSCVAALASSSLRTMSRFACLCWSAGGAAVSLTRRPSCLSAWEVLWELFTENRGEPFFRSRTFNGGSCRNRQGVRADSRGRSGRRVAKSVVGLLVLRTEDGSVVNAVASGGGGRRANDVVSLRRVSRARVSGLLVRAVRESLQRTMHGRQYVYRRVFRPNRKQEIAIAAAAQKDRGPFRRTCLILFMLRDV